jgi:hypothetical protein
MAQGAVAIRRGESELIPPVMSWIKVFDDEERLTMLSEIFTACVRASEEGDWDHVSDLIHQWHESAIVAESGILRAAMASEGDEQPLPNPETVVAETEAVCETGK